MNAPASIRITPVCVADLLAECERMPVYVHVIDHPDARVLVDTPSSFEGVCSSRSRLKRGPGVSSVLIRHKRRQVDWTHGSQTDGQRRHRRRGPRGDDRVLSRARPRARRASHGGRRVGGARHWTGRPARRDRHDAHAGRPQPARALALSRAACGRRSPERPGERPRLPARHVRRGRRRRDARPALESTVRSSSAATWSSTKTRIGSATSAGPKASSSGSPKNSARAWVSSLVANHRCSCR